MKAINAIIVTLISLPIWYYLLFQILIRVDASELMFFLYWIYVPFGVIATVIGKIVESE